MSSDRTFTKALGIDLPRAPMQRFAVLKDSKTQASRSLRVRTLPDRAGGPTDTGKANQVGKPRSPDGNMRTTEEQIKLLLEENRGLKSYIENMNSECLELNAVLFDEANKMLLHSQVDTLKAIISKLPSPVPVYNPDAEMKIQNSPGKKASHLRHNTTSIGSVKQPEASPKIFHRSCEDLSLLVATTSEEVLTTVSRTSLLNALLAETDGLEENDQDTFQDFVTWYKSGCPLQYPFDEDASGVVTNNGHLKTSNHRQIRIIRQPDSNYISELKSDKKNALAEKNPPSPDSTLRASPSNTGMMFLQRLYNDDIRPCLEFRDKVLQNAIHHALPELGLEINPFRNILDEHHSSDSNTPVICPLLPALEPAYQLLVKNSDERIEVSISAEARHRIAATMNLFQYLSCIARGVCSTPQSINSDRKLSIRRNSQLSGQSATMKEHMELVKYFKKIQSLRLAIAFARLGFGLPELPVGTEVIFKSCFNEAQIRAFHCIVPCSCFGLAWKFDILPLAVLAELLYRAKKIGEGYQKPITSTELDTSSLKNAGVHIDTQINFGAFKLIRRLEQSAEFFANLRIKRSVITSTELDTSSLKNAGVHIDTQINFGAFKLIRRLEQSAEFFANLRIKRSVRKHKPPPTTRVVINLENAQHNQIPQNLMKGNQLCKMQAAN
ncbi:hypothetical protein X801_01493 [Opisthorchis viverrini]|uniref:Uncharacterized protein n=1 Tax=Opisthorchis viverrini TaxID=6198 RepID=A0A1S8X7C0_OPIVI|nr:hypothetical protein X801_01493 [Opisthorchis viverrini]